MRAFLKIAMLIAIGWQFSLFPAMAVEPDEVLKDPVLEKRARVISVDLRCLVCQNQSIDDSNADLARDLRILVRERLKKGDTNEQVKDYVVARYGEFVLLNPRIAPHTWVMWFSAPVILILGIIGLIRAARRRKSRISAGSAPAGLSEEEQKRLNRIMKAE